MSLAVIDVIRICMVESVAALPGKVRNCIYID